MIVQLRSGIGYLLCRQNIAVLAVVCCFGALSPGFGLSRGGVISKQLMPAERVKIVGDGYADQLREG
jgi:hypothetical protein